MKLTVFQATYFIVVLTLCAAFLAWGTIGVLRRVEDLNYHAPSKMDLYKDCITTGYNPDANACKAVAGVK